MGGEIPEMTTFTTEDRIAMQASMNANELADELENEYYKTGGMTNLQAAAAMLRQQQAEIETQKLLKEEMHKFHEDAIKEAFKLLGIEHDEYRFKWVALGISQLQAEIEVLKADNDKLTEALNRVNRVYDFDNPLLDKAQEK